MLAQIWHGIYSINALKSIVHTSIIEIDINVITQFILKRCLKNTNTSSNRGYEDKNESLSKVKNQTNTFSKQIEHDSFGTKKALWRTVGGEEVCMNYVYVWTGIEQTRTNYRWKTDSENTNKIELFWLLKCETSATPTTVKTNLKNNETQLSSAGIKIKYFIIIYL